MTRQTGSKFCLMLETDIHPGFCLVNDHDNYTSVTSVCKVVPIKLYLTATCVCVHLMSSRVSASETVG